MIPDLLDLDAAAVLTASAALLVEQREQAVDELRLASTGPTCTPTTPARAAGWAPTS